MHAELRHGIDHVTIDHDEGDENAVLTIITPDFVHPRRTGWRSEDHVHRFSLPVSIWEWVGSNLSSTLPKLTTSMTTPKRVQQAIDTLLENHPLEYTPKLGESYKRCPVCEQWSPCDVRVVIEAALQAPPTSQTDFGPEHVDHVVQAVINPDGSRGVQVTSHVDVGAIISELHTLPAPPPSASPTLQSWYNGYVAALDALEEKLP